MTKKELCEQVLNSPLPPGELTLGEEDQAPAIKRILEGLAKRAATGDASASRELREWARLDK